MIDPQQLPKLRTRQGSQMQLCNVTERDCHHRKLTKGFSKINGSIRLEIEHEKTLFAPGSIATNMGKETQ